MRHAGLIVVTLFLLIGSRTVAQPADSGYVVFRGNMVAKFKNARPGKFGYSVAGIYRGIKTDRTLMALTFDACGGPTGSAYDEELIDWLKSQHIPATLFLAGSWIDAHPDLVRALSQDTLFEIENHGVDHCPCSINGRSKYGIRGTESLSQAVDEIELNARKIMTLTNRKPIFYRSATGSADEACGRLARALGEQIVSYELLSGDAVVNTPAQTITENLVKGARKGTIVIMHMNHPERNGFEALRDAVPKWKQLGYTFVKLEGQPLR